MELKNKQTSPNLSKIWLLVPNRFLQHFDEAIQNTFPSRSEAIRRGMSLVLDEVRRLKAQNCEPVCPPSQFASTRTAPQPIDVGRN